ncbi:hypothetical protein FGO68_gene6653 [Halteria grandinella]|uniref:Casein kinase I n=1 Tax=Halteria grandinella TaxID=5974 RepID=A0A8J8NU43_HALGN|nr:hypothetical protein FGO68_gene6653 [Halteria grandinella]
MMNEITFYTKFAQHAFLIASDQRKRIENVPRYVGTGKQPDGQAYLVTEYVNGQTLDKYVKEKAAKLQKDKTEDKRKDLAIATFKIFPQILDSLREFHSFQLIHRDIKPQNIMIKEDSSVLLIDFGTVINYKLRNGNHIEPQNGKPCIGSALFASQNTHLGFNQSRRDDLVQLIFSMIFVIDSALVADWVKGLSLRTSTEVWDQIYMKKQEYMSNKSIYSHPIHKYLKELLHEVSKLEFRDEPDYEGYKKMVKGFEMELQNIEKVPCQKSIPVKASKVDLNASIKYEKNKIHELFQTSEPDRIENLSIIGIQLHPNLTMIGNTFYDMASQQPQANITAQRVDQTEAISDTI